MAKKMQMQDYLAMDTRPPARLLPDGDVDVYESAEARGDVPQSVKPQLIADIRAAAAAQIEAVLPAWKQLNMVARAVELVDKGATRKASENAERVAILEAWEWIKQVRAESDRLEAAVMAAGSGDDAVAVLGGAKWPERQ